MLQTLELHGQHLVKGGVAAGGTSRPQGDYAIICSTHHVKEKVEIIIKHMQSTIIN